MTGFAYRRGASGTSELDPAQESAASFGLEGPGPHAPSPLLVLAGAGSGKTTTLVARVRRLVAAGIDPGRILALTFSRRAAIELSTRIRAAVPAVPADRVGTFHSVAAQMLRSHHARFGLPSDFAIVDRSDAVDLLAMVREGMPSGPAELPLPPPAACLNILSATLNQRTALSDVLLAADGDLVRLEPQLRLLFERYATAKTEERVLDFDDLLTVLDAALADPTFAADAASEFDHVLVDEYQDTNPLQDAILSGLRPSGIGLTVVGDDAQAIYGFRGATTDGIVRFAERFAPPATILRLETSYRCTTQILDLANDLIAGSSCLPRTLVGIRDGDEPRIVKVDDDAAQARFVVDEIAEDQGAPGDRGSRAILYRSGHDATAVEIELIGRGIPYAKRGGVRWTDAAHVRDFLAILRYATTPTSRSAGFRSLCLLPGVGSTTAGRILDASAGQPLQELDHTAAGIERSWLPELDAFAADLASIASTGTPAWACFVAFEAYRPLAQRRYVDAAERLADLQSIVDASMTRDDLRGWLDEFALDPIEAGGASASPETTLTLSTIHAAKGLEFDRTWILSCVEGSIPSRRATTPVEIEEERRILYVAVTRAASELTIVVPRWRGAGGRRQVRAQSRFLPPGRSVDRE